VEILGVQVGGFSEVSGIERETTLEDFREGGLNDYTHKLVTVTKYQNLTLRRGLADANELWQWHQDVVNGKIERRQVNVVLVDTAGNDTWRWVFDKAYPVKWTGTALNATTAAVFVESIELAHNGIRRG
jgi:phage tail-like protein